jgi:hypothetical protein
METTAKTTCCELQAGCSTVALATGSPDPARSPSWHAIFLTWSTGRGKGKAKGWPQRNGPGLQNATGETCGAAAHRAACGTAAAAHRRKPTCRANHSTRRQDAEMKAIAHRNDAVPGVIAAIARWHQAASNIFSNTLLTQLNWSE